MVSAAGKEISKEEGSNSLTPSSTIVEVCCAAEGCVDVVVRVFLVTLTLRMLWLGQLQVERAGVGCFEVVVVFSSYTVTTTSWMLAAKNVEAGFFSDVINSRLEK